MLQRTLKVVRVSQPDEVFNRHYQLSDFDTKGQSLETNKFDQSAGIDYQLERIINKASRSPQRSKSKDRKKDKKKVKQDPYSIYNEKGFSKADIIQLRKIQEQFKLSQYSQKSKVSKKELRGMKIKMKKAQDILNQDDYEDQEDQFCFRKDMFSDDEQEQKSKEKEKIKESNKKKNKRQHSYRQEFYPPFLSQQIVLESRKREENKFFLGQLFLHNPYSGKIITDEVAGDIQVRRENINRAMHESLVYFEFSKKQPSSDQEASEFQNQKQIKYCRIVCVKHNPLEGKHLIGKIQKYGDQFVFEPINTKIRKMNVGEGKPDKKDWRQQYYTAMYTSWETTQKFPMCQLFKNFGTIGNIQTQCKVLLQLNQVYEGEFGPEITQFLKKFTDKTSSQGQYIIPQQQYKKRYDLRDQSIFTIDPLTARDFDDALSIKLTTKEDKVKYGIESEKKVYEVGIHIADVSYFVEQNSPLDLEAQKRTTSVYLVHRVLPMLPRVLCQTMCSLNPGVQRLVVSVWCYIDEQGQVLTKTRFGRSIIKSKARYTYQTAQDVITQKIKSGESNPLTENKSFGAQKFEDQPSLFEDIKLMNKLAILMKSKRQSNGSLSIENHKKQFKLDDDCEPISYSISQRFEANFLVEEFMLLANIEVAQFVVRNIKDLALLRRHMFPSEKKIKRFKQFMAKFDTEFHIDKQTKLSEYISQIIGNPQMKASEKQLIQYELVFLLEAAEYFIVGDSEQSSWQHYALGYKQYTHFTSPIRRYPDIIAHRQLLKIIETNNLKLTIEQKIASKALIDRCNKCKIAARKVSSGCEKIFMCLYLKKNPVVNCRGIVTQIGSSTIIVCIPQYDIRTPIVLKEIKNLKEKKFEAVNGIKLLRLKYQNNTKVLEFILQQTQYVSVNLSATNTFPIDYSVKLVFPNANKEGKPIVIQ